MLLRLSTVVGGAATLLVGLFLTLAPSPQTSETASGAPPPDTTKPLRPLMVGLAQDMDRIATGLWHEDYDLIAQGAEGIAGHPKIPPGQLAEIKKALGNEFQTFVEYDKTVHRTASTLVDAATARDWSGIVEAHEQLQRGCMGCHTAFRDRLQPVLTTP